MLFKKQTEKKRRRGDRYQYWVGGNTRGQKQRALLCCGPGPAHRDLSGSFGINGDTGAPGFPSAQFRLNWPLDPGLWLLSVSNQGRTFWVQVQARGGTEER